MHVTFISQCKKKAIPKTLAVLDRYAIRSGRRTWTTPITKEALSAIHAALKQKATRQTAVACFINKGNRAMKLLWIVGNKNAFGSRGEVPIATRTGTIVVENKWLHEAVMLADTAGLTHDLGKMSLAFSSKISPSCKIQNSADPIRHELISAFIVKNMLGGQPWADAWPKDLLEPSSGIVKRKGRKDSGLLLNEVQSPQEALLFLIATHHHLFDKGSANRHVRPINGKTNAQPEKDTVRDDQSIQKITEYALANFQRKFEKSERCKDKWIGITMFARAALILADQKGSSDCNNPLGAGINTEFYANTTKVAGVSVYNQTLKYHLAKISSEAKRIASGMTRSPIAPISEKTRNKLLEKAKKPFDWQNTAAKALKPGRPTLLLNVAATGAGKTIMNMRAAAILAGDAPIAITTALGLRTLTLQTGDSYKKDLSMSDDEVTTIIGCLATRKLHEYEQDDENAVAPTNADERDEDEEDLLIESSGDSAREIPLYLQGFKKAESYAQILTSPVLVSTIDYVIAAGEPTRGSTHGLAMLRLMHSDLIIDEIDGFEPKSLAAILRIVKVSAMFGRNVIAASGTLPVVVAEYLLKAYEAGHKTYAAMNEIDPSFSAIVIDDSVPPMSMDTPDVAAFGMAYQAHLGLLQSALIKKPVTKRAVLFDTPKTETGINTAIQQAADDMHQSHSWVSSGGKRISIGLIRIANIKQAISVARNLSKQQGVHVVCYHSRHFMVQRYHIEQKLDQMLRRKDDSSIRGNKWMMRFEAIPEIAEILSSAKHDVKIIVVATPVEEVGRDHDFDWAIIEPSSTQSIVQTAGRVNRHRRIEITQPNVGILRYNFKSCIDKNDAFCRPGYEVNGSHKLANSEPHDVSRMIDFKLLDARLDSSLRFDETSHCFSRLDSYAIKSLLIKHADFFIDGTVGWMSSNEYREAALRDNNEMLEFYIQKSSIAATDSPPDFYERRVNRYGFVEDIPSNSVWDWQFYDSDRMLFGMSVDKMIEITNRTKIDPKMGLAVKCYEITQQAALNGKTHIMTKFGGIT